MPPPRTQTELRAAITLVARRPNRHDLIFTPEFNTDRRINEDVRQFYNTAHHAARSIRIPREGERSDAPTPPSILDVDLASRGEHDPNYQILRQAIAKARTGERFR